MARVKALMLGIDSLTYKYFMKCNSRNLLTLLDTTFRGVTENRTLQSPASAWLTTLTGKETQTQGFLLKAPELPLVSETRATLINVPLTNPTLGSPSFAMDSSTSAKEEVDSVVSAVLEALDSGPVIAAITALERLPTPDPCPIYSVIDSAARKLVLAADEFIVFSPYGPRTANGYDPYGVYLASRPRPNEHETVKLWEIGRIFSIMAGRD